MCLLRKKMKCVSHSGILGTAMLRKGLSLPLWAGRFHSAELAYLLSVLATGNHKVLCVLLYVELRK
jgi:hypothetical protein